MSRRPNTKNLPSRLFEETSTPIYMVGADYCVTYANPALSHLFGVEPDDLVGQSLKYFVDVQDANLESSYFALCPPPGLINLDIEDPVGKSTSQGFSVELPDGDKYFASCMTMTIADQGAERILVCSLSKMESDQKDGLGPHWLHEKIQQFRVSQSSRYNAIPYLGESFAAKKCFAQARSYALLEGNVSVVGHAESQILEVAKSIHYSGFTKLDEPEPLLPVDCQQVHGERIQEILVGHCQVNLSDADDSKAHILLMHADELDAVAQRDILTMVNMDQLQLRLIVTSKKPLPGTSGFDCELAHRLSTLELSIPDLVERRSDIPLLAQNILEQLNVPATSISDELIQYLQVYPWTSDYRELESVMEAAARQTTGGEVKLSDCPHDFRMALNALQNPVPKRESIDLDQLLSDIEKETIERAINHAKGNKTKAAKMLGITRARLHRKIADSADSAGDE